MHHKNLPPHFFKALADAVGHTQAVSELRWMRQAIATRSSTPHPDDTLLEFASRRTQGEPLQYILGTQPFGPLELKVRQPVLIPRWETEEWALRLSRTITPARDQPIKMLDLCTGTGCIPLLLNKLWPSGSCRAVAVDSSPEALDLARENASQSAIPVHELQQDDESRIQNSNANQEAAEPSNPISFLQADILHPSFPSLLKQVPQAPFQLITSNPPYISHSEYAALPPSVRDYEDPRALLGDPEPHTDSGGLTFYRHIAKLATDRQVLAHDGLLVLEVGHTQRGAVMDILHDAGITNLRVWHDGAKKERVVVGRVG